MTRNRLLPVAAVLALLGALGGVGAAFAVAPGMTTEQAASSTGNQPDAPKPGVTQLNEGSGCATTGDSAAAAGRGQTQQVSPSPCPTDKASAPEAQPKQ